MGDASSVLGYAAKLAEDKKMQVYQASASPVSSVYGGDHVFVPFSLEDSGRRPPHSGRIGAHGLALY